MTSSSDILLIGAGVTGLTTALQLAKEGASVTLLDRQRPGREASWAGAGMLPPGNLSFAATPEARLRSYSHALWPKLAAELKERTGIDSEYRRCGSIEVGAGADFQAQLAAWEAEQISVESLDRYGLEQHISELATTWRDGVWLPDFGQVRNPRHLKALQAACQGAGVEIVEDAETIRLAVAGGWVSARTATRNFTADRICVTAGAWTNRILDAVGCQIPVRPVRGQIVQLRVSQLPFDCVIEQGRRYIVPRADGLILVGSTEEHVGYEKRTTAVGISELIQFAASLVPELGSAEVVRSWAGLRPGTPDELPWLGRLPDFQNLFVGAGHFRSGLQMSPGTARILTDLLLDRSPEIDIAGLTCEGRENVVSL